MANTVNTDGEKADIVDSAVRNFDFCDKKEPLFLKKSYETIETTLEKYLVDVKKHETADKKDYDKYVTWLQGFLTSLPGIYGEYKEMPARGSALSFLSALDGKINNIDQLYKQKNNTPKFINDEYYDDKIGVRGANGFLESLSKKIAIDIVQTNANNYDEYFDNTDDYIIKPSNAPNIKLAIDITKFQSLIKGDILTKDAQKYLSKSLSQWSKNIEKACKEFVYYKKLQDISDKITDLDKNINIIFEMKAKKTINDITNIFGNFEINIKAKALKLSKECQDKILENIIDVYSVIESCQNME
jgi:hypothetical protein